jgi:hypothetical protein
MNRRESAAKRLKRKIWRNVIMVSCYREDNSITGMTVKQADWENDEKTMMMIGLDYWLAIYSWQRWCVT